MSNEEKRVEVKIPTEIYSRIVGYYRPLDSWHEGKKQEFKDRTMYNVQSAVEEDKDGRKDSG